MLLAKDAIFFSPHKFAGGPQAVGVLVYKKRLATRGVSSLPGGGTVFYVGPAQHVYLKNDEEREGGTPAIIRAIHAAVLQLKAVTPSAIARADQAILHAARQHWGSHPRIAILGHSTAQRLPIFALAIRATDPAAAGGIAEFVGPGAFWYHIVGFRRPTAPPQLYRRPSQRLFGIQARGGCMCAGPYSQSVLGIDTELSDRFEAQLVKKEDNDLLP